MSLLVLMYHRARAGRHGNAPNILEAHFAHIAARYTNVLPGEALASDRLNVALTFDDGTFDFYATVFPLLKRYKLRALLAVPPLHVPERTDRAADARLAVETQDAFDDPHHGGFCTWSELEEMVQSGHVVLAAHGFSHRSLDAQEANLPLEIDSPQAILSARCGQPVDSFVFPYGRYSKPALRRAQHRYRHVFRIGGALNRGWNDRILYRVDADAMADPWALFAPRRLRAYRARRIWNRLRGR